MFPVPLSTKQRFQPSLNAVVRSKTSCNQSGSLDGGGLRSFSANESTAYVDPGQILNLVRCKDVTRGFPQRRFICRQSCRAEQHKRAFFAHERGLSAVGRSVLA